jgi:hypothetical protein
MGTWHAAARLIWTDGGVHDEWGVEFEYELELGDRCTIEVTVREHLPHTDGQPRHAALTTTISGAALRDASGDWRLPLRFAFVDDPRSVTTEFHETVLLLGRASVGAPRLRGAFRKLDEEGDWLSLGLLAAERGAAPDPRTIGTDELACAARCRIECAGSEAEQTCLERNCAAWESHAADICGAPSYDFPPPMQARAKREQLRAGQDPFARAGLTLECQYAKALAGSWGLWLANEFATLELRNRDCELVGTVRSHDAEANVAGVVNAIGVWALVASDTPPSWLRHPLVLVGVDEHGPAFGIDAGEPPRPLRAFRISR